ncbi:TIGR01212 family radical SAM protein [Pontiellaceae bacterium B1224]|nr:TIGR01212 family radical SAM protein [Pontiellaceae bacterium B1224]
MKKPYLQYKDYMKERYGDALFRVPIDFNTGCPNRELDGSGGCTFCNVRGSAAVQTIGASSVEEQMKDAIRFARDRYGAKKYMAYIQAYSATFGKNQQPKYLALLDAFDFTAVSIGTRPDCLTPQAYDFLVELNKHIEVWVELGVQTVHDRTLDRINRGHDWASSAEAIKKLHELGIKVAAHAILGLPGETAEDFQQTADTLAALPIDAVKIHNLHIERGTTLALEHALTPLPVLMEQDFAEHLMDFIRRMPPNIPIMRLTTDTLDEELIAPRWHMAKGQFKDYVIQQMTCREWRQGDLFERGRPRDGQTEGNLKTVETEDGSVTFWNEDYKEHYHTPAGARLEAEEKYLVPGRLKERLTLGDIQLLDVCFGLGYNSLTALETVSASSNNLQVTALEMDRRVVGAASKNIQTLETDSNDWKKILSDLYENQLAISNRQSAIQILWGDARYTISKLNPSTFDLVFLDAFSTQRNSELWTVDFFRKLKAVMKPDAVLLTYCAAIPVRAGLMEAGFFVGETDPVGRQRGGTIAAMQEKDIPIPLPDHEIKMIRETTRGLPYRDPYGVWTNKEILRDRQERIIKSKQEDTSKN